MVIAIKDSKCLQAFRGTGTEFQSGNGKSIIVAIGSSGHIASYDDLFKVFFSLRT